MYRFPKDLYADIRIEEHYNNWMGIENGEMKSDGEMSSIGAFIRVYDGKMWYTCHTNNMSHIQEELDNLATLATPNPEIEKHSMIQKLEVHQDTILHFEGDKDIRKVSRDFWKTIIDHYIKACIDQSITEVNCWYVGVSSSYQKKTFYSSKGAAIIQDIQNCWLNVCYDITVDGVTTYGGKAYSQKTVDELLGHEEEILQIRDRYLDFAHNAVRIEPGEYTCVLSPVTTAMFTHESFGHKSEADYMLNDKTLQEEWILGKKVGSDKVSICDTGAWLYHGYTPYDDEGTKARETWLMKDGVLNGRLHDAKSAAILDEELTGNCRAASYANPPIVRMTNTYMAAGTDDPEQMIKAVKDGIYIYNVSSGTGLSTFTMKPIISYRIRDGKLCEPLRVNVVTGSVFDTLFEIDAVGTDYELFDTYSCGKNGQTVSVAAGGPSIRVKKLMVN